MKTHFFHKLKNYSADWQIGVFAIVLVTIARLLGAFTSVEWAIFDSFLRLRPEEPKDDEIVLIGINANDLQKLGTYPLPDRTMAQLISRVYDYDPIVVGLANFRDIPIGEGRDELAQLFKKHQNLVAIEKVLSPSIPPPAEAPPNQVGFDDYLIDSDGMVRRTFLGLSQSGKGTDFKFSFSLRLAERYLKQKHNLPLENGIRDRDSMRFDRVEISDFSSRSIRGYHSRELGGLQIFLNYRNSPRFSSLNASEVLNQNSDLEMIRNKIVIIGATDLAGAKLVNTASVRDSLVPSNLRVNPIFGLEYHAHAVSQIIKAVEDDRPFLVTWNCVWDYVWLVFWGCTGIVLGYFTGSSLKSAVIMLVPAGALVAIAYFSLAYFGWWLPIAPSLTVLFICGASYATSTLYQRDRALKERIDERQQTIEQTFNLIHNGPLQTLAGILRGLKENAISQDLLIQKLEGLNQEIRGVGEYLHNEYLTDEESFYLGNGLKLDLKHPIHELFFEVYEQTLERDLKGFQTLKVRIRDFQPIDPAWLTIEIKRELCRFLEEALCNVGKHAINATRLTVMGVWHGRWYSLSVTDNGIGKGRSHRQGKGTEHSVELARKLKGKFIREPTTERGITCEITWPIP